MTENHNFPTKCRWCGVDTASHTPEQLAAGQRNQELLGKHLGPWNVEKYPDKPSAKLSKSKMEQNNS